MSAIKCYQAITTRYLGPTNKRGSRVSAQAQAGRQVFEWDDAMNSEQNHYQAARAFAHLKGWLKPGDRLVGGAPHNLTCGYVWVICDKERIKAMKSCILYETPTFRVTSWGNGMSYALLHKPSGKDIYFQGEAAEEFRNGIGAGEALDPSTPYEDIFAEQWAVYALEEY